MMTTKTKMTSASSAGSSTTSERDVAWLTLTIEAWREYARALVVHARLVREMEWAKEGWGRWHPSEEEVRPRLIAAFDRLEHARNRLLDLGEEVPK